MPKVIIDGREVEVPAGATVLEAAQAAGVTIPTLCHLEGSSPDPSCFVCVVEVDGSGALRPSCALPVAEGMAVRTDTEEVRSARRAALELLLSDHCGDCVGPCGLTCPAHLEVADFVQRVKAGDERRAIAVVRRTLPLAASLGRVCPGFCERVCRRKDLDEAVSIRDLHRYVADRDRASGASYVPERRADTGKRVAIVGAGPAGLTAAYYLLQMGHACVIHEARELPGGLFRWGVGPERLPHEVLDGEIDLVRRLGAEIQCDSRLGRDVALANLRREHDAVLLAIGPQMKGDWPGAFAPAGHASSGTPDLSFVAALGLDAGPRGVKADRQTLATSVPGVFAAGGVVGGPNYGVHAVAAGRRAAMSIGQYLESGTARGESRQVNVLMRDMTDAERQRFHVGASPARRVRLELGPGGTAARGLTETEARTEAGRCLDCDCGKRESCVLRELAARCEASPGRYEGSRRWFERDDSHAEIVYESGKCVLCGRCLRVAAAAGEPVGLALVGRGFGVKVRGSLDAPIAHVLRTAGRRCAEACPTGALSLRRQWRDK